MEIGELEFKKICKRNPECYCPPRHILNHELANIPEYLRRYFMELGRKQSLSKTQELARNRRCKDCNMRLTKVHGDSDYCKLHEPTSPNYRKLQ